MNLCVEFKTSGGIVPRVLDSQQTIMRSRSMSGKVSIHQLKNELRRVGMDRNRETKVVEM